MSLRRLADAICNDQETKAFSKRVDQWFGKGGYCVNPFGDYMNADDFARDGFHDLDRLCEFLHLFGYVAILVVVMMMNMGLQGLLLVQTLVAYA